jgi:hypothetical protein
VPDAPDVWSIHELVVPSATQAVEAPAQMCLDFPANPLGAHSGYLVGSELPPETFPTLRRVTREGQRIVFDSLEDATGSISLPPLPKTLFEPSLYDTELGNHCLLARAADDKSRCLPSEFANWSLFFADPLCSEPIFPALPQPRGAFLSSVAWSGRARYGLSSVVGRTHIFALGATHSGAVYTLTQGVQAVCEPVATDLELLEATEMAPETFAEYELVRQPRPAR